MWGSTIKKAITCGTPHGVMEVATPHGVMEVAKRRVNVGARWKDTHQTNIRSVYKILSI